MRGRRGWRASVVWLAAFAAACGEVRLVDPTVTGVPVAGGLIEVGERTGEGRARLVFQGYVYGFERRGDRRIVRYLDAGRIVVGGRVAARRFVRAGEPVYRLDTGIAGARPVVEVRMTGSDAVPSCTFEAVVPVVDAPADGAVVPRAVDLVVPVAALGDASAPPDGLYASAEVEDGAGQSYRIDLVPSRTAAGVAVVVPADFLGRAAVGSAELTVRIERERASGASGGVPPCAPALLARAWSERSVTVHLE
ncbi:MAG TPA: hypothetical protein VF158_13435 [Longimicrobiales bacterium]